MKIPILDLEGKEVGKIDLPSQFNEDIRPDIIKRAVLAIQANKRQPYGASTVAGKRASAYVSKRRRNYKTTYGIGQARLPRKVMTRKGRQFNWVAAFAPGTVGGRRAHPPKAEKIWKQKVNLKERRKAIRSALSATTSKLLINKSINKEFPLIFENKLENISKTKEVYNLLNKIGLQNELERIYERRVRAGKGKSRGRKYKLKKGPLIVVSKTCPLINAAKNIPGLDIANVRSLNVELLAPGCKPGRLTIFTQDAIEKIAKENLFI